MSENLKNNSINEEKNKWFHFDLSFFFMYCYTSVDKVITVSKSECNFLINNLGLDNKKVFYNNLALPEVYFNNGIPFQSENIITYCGSWISRKGIYPMVEAMKIILQKHKNYKFRIIGVGENFEVLECFSDFLNQIEVIPFVEDKKELMNLYGQSSIFLFPSLSESFGLVVAEAMYCGCALISGPTGYAAEIINGQ
ncbi:glycosyltransferase family 4 protein [Flavobacterium ovatum]|uniref:glycosyltransferase family 4 protein n=1 Tax=Flavobacterium ovatum TaxID=1928857 RepID=UPI00344C4145